MPTTRTDARHASVPTRRTRADAVAGFSLIEILIVTVIVGILAAVAVPSYAEHLRGARRADATLSLVDLSARLERHYTETGSYASATIATGEASDVLASAETPEGFYTLSIVAEETTASAFTIRATRRDGTAQSGDARCGDFTLTDLERRGVTGGGSVAECW